MNTVDLSEVAELLYREGAYLDTQRWDDWLALYTDDCEFWVAAWKGLHELADDPGTEISLIYNRPRRRLEERIVRIRSGMSSASTPLPRTWHAVGNIRALGMRDGLLDVHAQWQARSYRHGLTDTLYGRYEYRLAQSPEGWRIQAKKIVVVNDTINAVLDIYHV